MALDLGLGKRPRNRNRRQPPKPAVIPDYEPQRAIEPNMMSSPQKPAPDSSTIENRRTILACYLQCASVSMSLRLPNALRFTSYMAECLEVLENSPDAAPTDKRFAAWVRLQRLVEDAVNAFALDDPESTVSLVDIRIQNQLKGYEHQMKEYLRNLEPGVMNSFLEVNFHVNNVFLHEISMHPDHEPEDFRPPFYVATQIISNIPTNQNPHYVNAIMECVSSAQSVLNLFLKMPLDTIRALPALIFVRAIYSCVVLIKLEISTNAPGSELANVLDQKSLKVPAYLQKVIAQMVAIVGNEGKFIIAAKFMLIVKRLVEWYRNYKTQLAAGTEQDTIPFQPPKPPTQVPQQPQQSSQPQSTLPQFNTLPPQQFQNFSPPPQQQSQQQLPPSAQNFNTFQAPIFTSSPPPTSPPQPQQPYDFHGAMLATNTSSPNSGASDYNSPEYGPSDGAIPPGDESSSLSAKMEVDPNFFSQLQNIEQPFAFNPDPNDWMFDPQGMMGLGDMGGMGMGMGAGAPEFEWGPLGEGQATGVPS
ncbi:uncharacterized protein KY384_000335 [Bacidia gigantensis]|uniref:uncharacterized protein n=1 Tax=Bacidia gigantensis TaxID=2732470 RepID=UPI001D043618|nr:uncharacterized protein KY384_000335 [Bacidia gigantensis]KAG8526342.1 hypothetical protein KY384_000335 [Bacidia gigantensis]